MLNVNSTKTSLSNVDIGQLAYLMLEHWAIVNITHNIIKYYNGRFTNVFIWLDFLVLLLSRDNFLSERQSRDRKVAS